MTRDPDYSTPCRRLMLGLGLDCLRWEGPIYHRSAIRYLVLDLRMHEAIVRLIRLPEFQHYSF